MPEGAAGHGDVAGRVSPSHSPVSNDKRRDDAADGPQLADIARDVWAGRRTYPECYAAFETSIIYAQRAPHPGVLVTDVTGRGRWVVAFSRLERLAAHAGVCDYLATTGADFLELLPDGVGVMLDPDDQHRFPVLTRVAPAAEVAAAWARLARQRGWITTGDVAELSDS